MGVQIGHIGRNVVSKLAPFIDRRDLMVEGILTGDKGFFDMPIDLKLYGTSEEPQRSDLKKAMQDAKLPVRELIAAERARKQKEKTDQKKLKQERSKALAEARKQGASVRFDGGGGQQFEAGSDPQFSNLTVPSDEASGPSLEDLIDSSTTFNPRELGEVVNKNGASEQALAALPLAQQPPGFSTNLLPYQLQGLCWLLDRESPVLPPSGSTDSVQLWKRDTRSKDMFTNIATSYTTRNPGLASGGILADDMGLGKTIQMIALLMADPRRASGPTLIVAPLSVMSNWSGQMAAHVAPDHALKVLSYHGAGKSAQKPDELGAYDVVITTYQTMALEYMPAGQKTDADPVPRKTGLFSLPWRRVILDEGHQIRNPKSKMAQAAYNLQASSRWILSGTPIVNSLRDLQSHIRFIGLTGGLERPEVFSGALMRPLSQGSPDASLLLQALISTLCLRRMKDMRFIDLKLPPLAFHKYTVAWHAHEREKYEAFRAEAAGLVLRYETRPKPTTSAGAPKNENTYSHLLEVLLRMRQTCNHWALCGERVHNLLAALAEQQKLSLHEPENVDALRRLLQLSIDSQEECAICLDTLHNPVITACAHVFGGECIERVIATQHKCPMCRAELPDAAELVQPAAPLGESVPDDDAAVRAAADDADAPSSKVSALLDVLAATAKKPGIKTVVFSQWTGFLDLVENQLLSRNIRFCRLDGTMSAARRDEAMAELATDARCAVMLASLSVCSVGLNLVAASQVVLCDSWWAPAIEDQAVDRVHRLGQTRPTTVFRLVMEDSVEERVLDIQKAKRELTMTAFRDKKVRRGEERAARLADIKALLA